MGPKGTRTTPLRQSIGFCKASTLVRICGTANEPGTECEEPKLIPGHFVCFFSAWNPSAKDTLSLSGESKVLCQTRGGGGVPGVQKRRQKKMTAGRRPFMGSPSLPKTPSLPPISAVFVCTHFSGQRHNSTKTV